MYLTFWETSKLFKLATSFCNPTRSVWRLRFLHNLVVFILATLAGVKCYVTVVLTCISLMTKDTEHLSMCHLPCVYLLWRNIYSNSWTVFIWVFFLLSLRCVHKKNGSDMSCGLFVDAPYQVEEVPFCPPFVECISLFFNLHICVQATWIEWFISSINELIHTWGVNGQNDFRHNRIQSESLEITGFRHSTFKAMMVTSPHQGGRLQSHTSDSANLWSSAWAETKWACGWTDPTCPSWLQDRKGWR